MYSNPQKRQDTQTQELRKSAGKWLRGLREAQGLSQRELAHQVGVEYYTFISQLETGRGRIPPDKYRVWADALGLPVRDFVRHLFQFYDPITFDILFSDEPAAAVRKKRAATVVKTS
ncbi:MAG: Cro/Cl family transcriptional regulator [Alphaproteobacteria bacterium BRH_c36]|nr:MAG: Cro/Cl family transcriptional regulator [Alphaproteobacteria bacterium BRH_c36]